MTAQDTAEHPSLKRAVGGVLPGLAWSVTTAPMAQLPLVLVPAYLVPLFVILHLTVLFQAGQPALSVSRTSPRERAHA